MSFLSGAAMPPAVHAAPIAAATASANVRDVKRFMRILPCCVVSVVLVRERPYSEITEDIAPQPVETFRLERQEQYDQRAKYHQAQIGNDICKVGLRQEQAAKSFEKPACGNWQQGDEDGAKNRAQHRAEPADDDHGQVVDRDVDLKLFVVGDAEIVSVENASDTGVERRDRERNQLVAEDVDADEFGGDVVVADGDEGAPDAAAHQVDGGNDRKRRKKQQEQIELRLALERVPKQTRAWHLDRGLHAAGDPRHVVNGPLDDELRGERRDREVEALDAQ